MTLPRLILVLALVCPSPALAFDPATEWHTLAAPRFRVHYPRGLYRQALAVARSAEHALDELSMRLAWMPSLPIDIVLADETDSANGFAQSVPYNLIVLNAVAPEEISDLGDYDDWTYTLVAHELAHIVHIDTILGLPALFNALFGRWLAPNGIQPTWLVEGLATYYESALTSAGRVRSPYFDMILRMAVLDEGAMDLGVVSGAPRAWPQGTVPYLYGGRFTDYLVRRFGEDVLYKVSYDHGGRLLPFAVNASLSRSAGVDYPEIYADFVAHLETRYRAQRDAVNAAGRIEGQPLTERGQEIGPARIGENGSIYFVEAPIGEHAVLMAKSESGEREIAYVESGARLALIPGEQAALVAQIEVSRTYRFYGDLFRVDLHDGSSARLTRGGRIHGLDVSPDGRYVVFAQLDGAHGVIRRAPLYRFDDTATLADLGPMTQVWSPRFSPDGDSVVFAGFREGRRDLFRVAASGGAVQRLTHDTAVEGAPAFTLDGRFILYHSDRDGIFNIYALPAAGGEPRRLTRVLGGAFEPEPTPDGSALVYRRYGPRGFDLARLPIPDLDAAQAAEAPLQTRERRAEPLRLESYPAEPYSAWPTVLPRGWLPVFGLDARGNTYGAAL
ncbi:MAG: PD40 domain-containing protein, partial [Deltaproteobacteria bacterium]|nr:PD40 domain-containing protein [Deltaproteobacteria bacterium]